MLMFRIPIAGFLKVKEPALIASQMTSSEAVLPHAMDRGEMSI